MQLEDAATMLWVPLIVILCVMAALTGNGWLFWLITGLLLVDTLAMIDWRGDYHERTHHD